MSDRSGLSRAREFFRRYQHPEGLFWLRRVNHPLGALIAFLLLHTRVTPNALTVAGLLAHVVGAAIVALGPAPATPLSAMVVVVVWQLAFSLDCADGPLARARAQASPFGAWLDQLVDVMSHAAVYTGIVVFVVRALGLDAVTSVVLASLAVSLSLLQTFTTWQRQALIAERPVGERASPAVRAVHAVRHLVDYGAFLFVAAVLTLWPIALLLFVGVATALNALYVAAQLALNYRSHRRAPGSHGSD